MTCVDCLKVFFSLNVPQTVLLIFAVLSALGSWMTLLSQLVVLSSMPGLAVLAISIGKAAVGVAFNVVRLLLRREHRVKNKEYQSNKTSREQESSTNDKKWLRKGIGLNSVKAREYWAEISDDVLGTLLAAVAVVGYNGDVLQDGLAISPTVVLIALSIIAVLVKVCRLFNEILCLLRRTTQKKIIFIALLANSIGITATGMNIAALVFHILRLFDVVALHAYTVWYLPLVHVPVLQKSKKLVSSQKSNPEVQTGHYVH